jgi:hypothetical protein
LLIWELTVFLFACEKGRDRRADRIITELLVKDSQTVRHHSFRL